jgi:hypothetical protein
MPAESKAADQVKKPAASSTFIQQRNLVLAEMSEQEVRKEA